MKNINLIESAMHNRKAIDKSLRNLMVAILVCAIPAAICRLFFWDHTYRSLVRYRTVKYVTDVGWPATIYKYGVYFAIAFALIYIYFRFRQDLSKPSFGVANDGIFINQQMFYNAFVPWQNIATAELLGPAGSPFMRLTFKDHKELLKGQPFILKSIAKAGLKNVPVLSITKSQTVGDIKKMYEIIEVKLVH